MVMIGDSNTDIRAGKNAGTTTIGALTGYFEKDMLAEELPDFIFESISDIPENLDKILEKINEKLVFYIC